MEQNLLNSLSIEYLKSYFSVNSYIGCTINCAYCFLAPIKIVPMRPIKVCDEEDIISRMLNSQYFKRNETVISLNNRTDPFICDEVKQSTFKLLDIMEKEKLKNIVTITTKGLLTEEDSLKLNAYKFIKVVIIVTYNGMPKNIQPIDISIQEQTMKNVSKYDNVLLLHQFRPIIPNLNDSEENIRKIVSFASKYCKATIYQGVRVNEQIYQRLRERGYEYEGKFDTHKIKDKTIDNVFTKLKKEMVNYPIFEHTSCCLSYLFNQFDYNLHFTKMSCNNLCLNYERCKNYKSNNNEQFLNEQLLKIGIKDEWFLDNGVIRINGLLNDEQKSYIKHILKMQVKALGRENTFSEKIMESKDESIDSV